MSAQNAAADDDTRFERAVRMFAEVCLPPARTVQQLLRAGFTPARVRARFPEVPETAFVIPSEPRRERRELLAQRASASSSSSEEGRALVPVRALAQRALEHTAIAATQSPPAYPATAASRTVGGIAFQYVPLIQCSFPHADPGAQTHFTRRNGWLELTLSTARPDTGLPYGVPARLLTIYCATEALRTRSPEIFLGASVQDFLRRLDVPITRGDRGSLRVYANQLLRLMHCAVSIDENIRDSSGRAGLHIRQALFVEEARLWWDHDQAVGQGSSLVLSSVLYESMLERSAPLSTNAIRELRKSPMDLDVYAWLAHRLFQLSRPSVISWTQLSDQFGHNYGELRYFRRFFGDSLQRVLKVYPEAKLKCTDTGVTLLPSRSHIQQRFIKRT